MEVESMEANQKTKEAVWKLAYYCETLRNGKTDEEARKIARAFSKLAYDPKLNKPTN
jgi:hypothetical protein